MLWYLVVCPKARWAHIHSSKSLDKFCCGQMADTRFLHENIIGVRVGGVTPGHVDAAVVCGFGVKACGAVVAAGSC
eukprot:2181635-Prorocentrum_lima.AAC.1